MIGRDLGSHSIMTASRQRSELLRAHLETFTRLLQRVEGGDVRAIHRTRVASRRLRELMPVLQVDPSVCARLLRDLRRATRALGRIRELDVTAQLVATLSAETEDARRPALARVSDQLKTTRQRVFSREARKGRLGPDLHRLAKRLDRLASTLDRGSARTRQSWRWALEARVVHRADVLKEAIRAAGPFYLPEHLHVVRIALKKLRYSLELDADAKGTKLAEAARLRRGQELLGTLHDRQMLIERFREAQATLEPGERRVSRQLDGLIARLEDECRLLHAQYVRQRKGMLELCDRLAPTVTEGPDATAAAPATRRVAAR